MLPKRIHIERGVLRRGRACLNGKFSSMSTTQSRGECVDEARKLGLAANSADLQG